MKSRFAKTARNEPASSPSKPIAAAALCSKQTDPSRYSRFLPSLLALAIAGAPWGCRCDDEGSSDAPDGSPGQSTPASAGPGTPGDPPPEEVERVTQNLLSLRERCELTHHGLVLDLGDPSIEARRGYRLGNHHALPRGDRGGATLATLEDLQTKFTIWVPETLLDAQFSALVYGGASERMAAYVDGQRLGGVRVRPDQLQVAQISSSRTIEAGRHELTISLSRPSGAPPSAEVGWVRLGNAGQRPDDHPPSREEVIDEVTLAETPRQAAVLRPGSAFKCPLWIPAGASFATQVGVWGDGEGEAEVVVRTADGIGHRIARRILSQEQDTLANWVPVEAPLAEFANQLVDLELHATQLSEGARLAFAEPRVVSQPETRGEPGTAQRAIVIVLSGLSRRHVPPLAAKHGLPVVNRLAAADRTYPGYRLPTTYAPGVMGSLLTGVDPWQHGLTSDSAPWSTQVAPLAESVEAAGGRAALFTGVPTSFAAYGFDRGFSEFVAISPVADEPDTAPLARAEKWLGAHLSEKTLTIIHLRGGHPPFDIPQKQARQLPPNEYGGDLEPRRAAIQLSHVRMRSRSRSRRLDDADWTRLLAMQERALAGQSAALTDFFDWLGRQDAYDDSLIVLTSELGAGEPPEVPFAVDAPIQPEYLEVPLIVKFPNDPDRGRRTDGAFTTIDLTKTIAASLGLDTSRISERALRLGSPTAESTALLRALVAYRDGQFATEQGVFRLLGSEGTAPRLCDTAVDPACDTDRSAEQPIAARALWHATWEVLEPWADRDLSLSDRPEPEPDHEAALTVWGVPR